MFHCLSNFFTNWRRFPLSLFEDIVVGRHNDKHVVDANTKANEWQDCVHRRVWKAQEGTNTHGNDHAHRNAEETHESKIESKKESNGLDVS